MKSYVSHKIVKAGKIIGASAVNRVPGLLGVKVDEWQIRVGPPAPGNETHVYVSDEVFQRLLSAASKWAEANRQAFGRGYAHDLALGYLVQYEDGYLSWSPPDAFEAGYQAVDTNGMRYVGDEWEPEDANAVCLWGPYEVDPVKPLAPRLYKKISWVVRYDGGLWLSVCNWDGTMHKIKSLGVSAGENPHLSLRKKKKPPVLSESTPGSPDDGWVYVVQLKPTGTLKAVPPEQATWRYRLADGPKSMEPYNAS